LKKRLISISIALLCAAVFHLTCKKGPAPLPEHVIRVVSEADFQERVLRSNLPVLVDFFADWCYPCRVLSPLVAQVASDRADQVTVVKVDVDDSPGLARRYGIKGLPTLVLFADGKEFKRLTGLTDEAGVLSMLPKKQ